ncbi:MAG: hypothetical protein FJW30_29310 [Acidobacteria bacterium]|nr:hypothetical protein [Acidobacteriota bacterium]
MITLSTLLAAASSHAAPDAGAKAHGYFNFYGHSAQHSFTSARAHVDTYQRYLSETHGIAVPAGTADAATTPVVKSAAASGTPEFVDPEIAREAGDAISDDIERIQRHVARMRGLATTLGDKTALTELHDLEKKLGDARRAHAALHEHHAADSIAPAQAMELAQKVNEALRAAHAEHDDVMRRIDKPAAAR